MTCSELAALLLRLTALVVKIEAVFWTLRAIAALFVSIARYGRDVSPLVDPVYAVTASALPAAAAFATAYFLRRCAKWIVAAPSDDLALRPDAATAPLLAAVVASYGAILLPAATWEFVMLAAKYGMISSGSFAEPADNGWIVSSGIYYLFDFGVALISLVGARFIAQAILRLKRPRLVSEALN